MKSIFLLIGSMVIAVAAQGQLSVKGTIAGADSLQIYFLSEDGKTKDTVRIGPDGKFSFTVMHKPAEEDMFALLLEGVNAPLLLFGDHATVEFTAGKDKFPVTNTLQAGQQTLWMQEYHKSLQPMQQKAAELNTEAAEIDGADDKAVEAFRMKADVFNRAVLATGTGFIQKHPKAHASLYLLTTELQARLEPARFIQLFKGLDPLVKNSKAGKEVAEYVTSLEKTRAR